MKRNQKRKMLVGIAGVSFLLCLLLQCVCFYALENAQARFVSPISGENTLIRIQRLPKLTGTIDTVFLGSSVTERFISRGRCATVAVSHSPYMTGMRYMEETLSFPAGTVYILETTNMLHPSENEITKRIDRWDFQTFKTSPVFSIAAKPINLVISSVFYLAECGSQRDLPPLDVPATEPENLADTPDLTSEEKAEYKEYIDAIEHLKQMGGRVCFMTYPRIIKNKNFDRNHEIACKLAKHTGVPLLNYHVPYWDKRLKFSDGFHLVSRDPLTIRFMNTVARDAHACTDGQ